MYKLNFYDNILKDQNHSREFKVYLSNYKNIELNKIIIFKRKTQEGEDKDYDYNFQVQKIDEFLNWETDLFEGYKPRPLNKIDLAKFDKIISQDNLTARRNKMKKNDLIFSFLEEEKMENTSNSIANCSELEKNLTFMNLRKLTKQNHEKVGKGIKEFRKNKYIKGIGKVDIKNFEEQFLPKIEGIKNSSWIVAKDKKLNFYETSSVLKKFMNHAPETMKNLHLETETTTTFDKRKSRASIDKLELSEDDFKDRNFRRKFTNLVTDRSISDGIQNLVRKAN